MTTLAELEVLRTAYELVRRRLRLSIVSSLTGVSQRMLRGMWREVHGEGAPNGKLPESVLSFMTNTQAAADIAAFLGLYLQQHGNVTTIDPKKLLSTLDLGARMGVNVSVTTAYYGLRDLRAGFIAFPRCHTCSARFVFDSSGGRHSDRCPFCGTMPHKH